MILVCILPLPPTWPVRAAGLQKLITIKAHAVRVFDLPDESDMAGMLRDNFAAARET